MTLDRLTELEQAAKGDTSEDAMFIFDHVEKLLAVARAAQTVVDPEIATEPHMASAAHGHGGPFEEALIALEGVLAPLLTEEEA